MSLDVDDGVEEFRRKRARGGRVRAVREALGESGDEFARRLMGVAEQLGHPGAIQLDKTIVSNIENGKRQLSVEEAAAIVVTDPERRRVEWLVFGAPAAASALILETSEGKPRTSLDRSPHGGEAGARAKKKTTKKKASGE